MHLRNTFIPLLSLSLLSSLSTVLIIQAAAQSSATKAKLEQLKAGMPLFDQKIKSEPGSAENYYMRALANHMLHNFDAAEADFAAAEALHYNANQYDLNLARGSNYLFLKKYDLAINTLTKALAIKPGSASALCNRGCALLELGRFREALDDGLKAIRLDSTSTNAHLLVGECYQKCGQPQYALQYLNQAISREPKNFEAFQYRALAYQKLGKKDLAAKDFSTATALGYTPGSTYIETKE